MTALIAAAKEIRDSGLRIVAMAERGPDGEPIQRPLDPGAGFVSALDPAPPGDADKPDKPLDRVGACLGYPGLKAAERIVLTAIALFDGPGGAFPSTRTLADVCNMSTRTVRRYVAALRAASVLNVRKRRRATPLYSIAYPKGGQQVAALDPPKGGQQVAAKGGQQVSTELEVEQEHERTSARAYAQGTNPDNGAEPMTEDRVVADAMQAVRQGLTIDQVTGLVRTLFERVPAQKRRMGKEGDLERAFRAAFRGHSKSA
ncbi:MAG: helix-turn-helix domain-containing protein [Chromatiales bacterium]|nr:helix-turn-helix domain-containing protein [Chromatiales bacterium]